MSEKYIIGIDQSTQGTKAILMDCTGRITAKSSLPHRQIISEQGWVSHDPEEIFRNVIEAARQLIEKSGAGKGDIAAIGISNQRETTVAWDRVTGKPVGHAIVWQCPRAVSVTEKLSPDFAALVRERTGIPLSPYFPAAKAAWIMRNSAQARELQAEGRLCLGTIDAWLVFRLTGGQVFQTDFSNASRTELFDLRTLCFSGELCEGFGVPLSALPRVTDSDGDYGSTDLSGVLEEPVPIRAVMGDSHAALFGQGCVSPGMAKATYGTGSSVMMNIGPDFRLSSHGLVTSLAWSRNGRADYVLEGNINYSGAIISWLCEIGLLKEPKESGALAEAANPCDTAFLVPAFSGLGAPYWNSGARASFVGMSRTTGRAELIRAGLEAIAYQVTDIVSAMTEDTGFPLTELRADGGPTLNRFLMQFQSDLAGVPIRIPEYPELSAAGAARMAGAAAGFSCGELYSAQASGALYVPRMDESTRKAKYGGWKEAVRKTF